MLSEYLIIVIWNREEIRHTNCEDCFQKIVSKAM